MAGTNFSSAMWSKIEYILQNTSCHGGNWVMKWSNPKLKSIGIIIAFSLQVWTFWYVFYQLTSPIEDFNTSIQLQNENMYFPNVTICNPRLYDRKKVEGKIVLLRVSFQIKK